MPRRPTEKFGIAIEGLEQLEQLDSNVHLRQRLWLNRTVRRIAGNIAAVAPGGPEGSVGRSFRSRLITDTVGAISSDHPGAKALDRGAFIQPKHGQKAVRWFDEAGNPQFARYVRLKPRRYVRRGLRTRNQVARAEFEQTMSGL